MSLFDIEDESTEVVLKPSNSGDCSAALGTSTTWEVVLKEIETIEQDSDLWPMQSHLKQTNAKFS